MLVETVWFTVDVKLPALPGRSRKIVKALSTLNDWEKMALEMEASPQMQVLMIRHRLPPEWEIWIPFGQCKFMHMKETRHKVVAKPKNSVQLPKRRVVSKHKKPSPF